MIEILASHSRARTVARYHWAYSTVRKLSSFSTLKQTTTKKCVVVFLSGWQKKEGSQPQHWKTTNILWPWSSLSLLGNFLLLLNQTISCVTAGRRLARCPEACACDVPASWRPEPVASFEANGALLWQPREQTSPMACAYCCYGNRSKSSESHKLLPRGWSRHRFRADHHLLCEGDNVTRLSRSANEILCPFARRQMPDGEKKKKGWGRRNAKRWALENA